MQSNAALYISPTHSSLKAKQVRPYVLDKKKVVDSAVFALRRIGIQIKPEFVAQQVHHLLSGAANDAAFTPAQTAASVPTPIQFLQTWLPGFIQLITSARKIDDLIGIKTVGSWSDAEIVQGVVEPGVLPTEYGDYANLPLADWQTNFERRSVVRGLIGMQVGLLEEDRAAAMRLSSSDTKRRASAVGLEIMRNAIGFYGWLNGNNRTFGILNDPNLPAFNSTTVTGGWGGTNGTFAGITGDLRAAVIGLRTQSQDLIDPEKVEMTLALPTSHVDYLTVTTDFGVSVRDWLKETYPKIRVVSAPELNAVSSTNPTNEAVFYLFAEEIPSDIDGSTDGGETFIQLVQTKFMTLGVEKKVTMYQEGYANASAGVLCKRPWAVYRVMGI
jgi:hypothetical protein